MKNRVNKNSIAPSLLTLLIGVLAPLFSFGQTSKIEINYIDNSCIGHGGVDCSTATNEGYVVCKDNTINDKIYFTQVLECQINIDNQAQSFVQQGCFPPNEFEGCKNEASYHSLLSRYSRLKILGSEISNEQLIQCRQQINDYNIQKNNYKQCLEKWQTQTGNKVGLDFFLKFITKTYIDQLGNSLCPILYGENSSYDEKLEQCECNDNYYLTGFYNRQENNQCLSGLRICQKRYGPNTFEINGNCYIYTPSPLPTTIPVLGLVAKTPSAKISPSPRPRPNETQFLSITPTFTEWDVNKNLENPETPSQNANFLVKAKDLIVRILSKLLFLN